MCLVLGLKGQNSRQPDLQGKCNNSVAFIVSVVCHVLSSGTRWSYHTQIKDLISKLFGVIILKLG